MFSQPLLNMWGFISVLREVFGVICSGLARGRLVDSGVLQSWSLGGVLRPRTSVTVHFLLLHEFGPLDSQAEPQHINSHVFASGRRPLL